MLTKILTVLERRYGRPEVPPAKGPFELILWENAVYLLPDERRAEVFEGLRRQVGLSPRRSGKRRKKCLLPLAARGGMHPETRVLRWREIARITLQQFGGDLAQVLTVDYAKAKKALKQFPSIGDPGAEKILMYCGRPPGCRSNRTGCVCSSGSATATRTRRTTGPYTRACKKPSPPNCRKARRSLRALTCCCAPTARPYVRMPIRNASNARSRSTVRSLLGRESERATLFQGGVRV